MPGGTVEGFRIAPGNGAATCGDFEPILPLTRLRNFRFTPLEKASELTDEQGSFASYRLPTMRVGNVELIADIEFNRWQLVIIWLTPFFDGDTHDDARGRPEAEGVAMQETWLKEHVGCPSGEYPWGTVWNRRNIHADYFDIAVFFSKPGDEQRRG